MRTVRAAVLLALLAPAGWSAAAPPVIRTLEIAGSRAVPELELRSWLASRPGQPYDAGALRSDLVAAEERYRARGFLGARVEVAESLLSADGRAIDLGLRVTEGRLTVVGSLRLTGGAGLPAGEALEVRPGAPLDQAQLERDLDALLRACERRGRPFARCAVDSMTLRRGGEADSVDIVIVVEEGPAVRIDEIRVQGNRETRAEVITRETRLAAGALYDPEAAERIRRRLLRLNLFTAVEEPALYLREGRGGLLVRVQEGPFNTFDGILGYVPGSTPGEAGFLTGLASVSMRNLFGSGRRLAVRWRREDRNSQELGVQYLEPWVLGSPVNVGGGFMQRQQDTAYVHRVLDGRIEAMPAEDLTAGLTIRSERVIPSSDSGYVSPVPRSSTVALGADLLYDTRSDPVNPTAGARYRVEYSYGRKSSGASPLTGEGAGTGSLQRLLLDVELYLRLFERQVAALALHGYDVRGGGVGEPDMFRFGGAATLRGYRESQFLGARVAWTNAEYRFLLGRRSFFFLFFDTGYYSRPADAARAQAAAEALKYGYGLGVRVDTPLGSMGVSFALGQGDSFSQAKIHVGIINEF